MYIIIVKIIGIEALGNRAGIALRFVQKSQTEKWLCSVQKKKKN